jgi:hypothetical protein
LREERQLRDKKLRRQRIERLISAYEKELKKLEGYWCGTPKLKIRRKIDNLKREVNVLWRNH